MCIRDRNTGVPIQIVIRFRMDEAVEPIGYLTISHNNDTHITYAGTFIICRLEAVSYTHLDVYKRQGLFRIDPTRISIIISGEIMRSCDEVTLIIVGHTQHIK